MYTFRLCCKRTGPWVCDQGRLNLNQASSATETSYNNERGMCIKGLFWPPLEQKTENGFSPISSYWFIRRIAQVLYSGIYFTLTGCYGNQNG